MENQLFSIDLKELDPLQLENFDLQFFASAEDEGRTEDPTEKRREEAQEEGQFPRTEELPGALIMGAGFLIIWIFGGWMLGEIEEFTREVLSLNMFDDVNPGNIMTIFRTITWITIRLTAPVASVAFLAGAVAHLSQVGFLFTVKPLKPDLSNLKFSMKKLLEKVVFSKKVAWKMLISAVKLIAVALVALEVVYSSFDRLILLVDVPLLNGVSYVLSLAFEIIWKTVLILFIISPIDWAFQKYQHEQSIMMTPQQKKDERKQSEGDPEIKRWQQQKMREMMQRRVEQEVPDADVVITNPTHYAVALVFDEELMDAPRVVAKGKDLLAQRIRQLARENAVPIYRIPLLARTLFQLELNQEIPPVLYDAVATVLAWVQRNRKQISRKERAQIEQKVRGIDLG